MVDRIDPAGRLREIGRSDTPPLDGDRLARIEARVLATIAEPLVSQPSVAGIDSRRRFAPMIAIAAALLVLAVLGVVALAARGGGDGLVIEAAEGVVIDVPGGEPAVGSSGDRLPDGTVVEIGPAGSATIDGVTYGPGRYVVGGGTLRPDPPGASPAGDSGDTPAPASTSSTTTAVPPEVERPVSATSTSTTSRSPVPTSVAVRPAEPPRATRPPAVVPTSTTRPERTTTTTPATAPSTRPPTTQPPPTQPPATRPATTTTSAPSTRPPRP